MFKIYVFISFLVILLVNFTVAKDEFEYVGCFQDKRPNDDRLLEKRTYLNEKNSVYNCVKHCQDSLYEYAGLEYSVECWCGHRLKGTDKYPKLPDSSCNYACCGNMDEKCGGDLVLSVYKTGTKTISQEDVERVYQNNTVTTRLDACPKK